jgi:hypothetical protein
MRLTPDRPPTAAVVVERQGLVRFQDKGLSESHGN